MSEQDTETQSTTDENQPPSKEVENCRSSGEYSLLGEVEFDFSGLPVSSDDSQNMDNVEEEEVFFGPVNFKEKLAVMAIEDTMHPADNVIDEDWEKIQQEAMNVVTAIKEATPLMPLKKTKRRFERVSPEPPKPVKRIRKHSSPMLVELSPYDKMTVSPEKTPSPEKIPSPKVPEKASPVKEHPKFNAKYTLDMEAIENGTDPALQTSRPAQGGPSPAKQRCVDKGETKQRFIDKSDTKESKMPMKRRSLQAPRPAAKFGFKAQTKSRQSVGAPRSSTPSSLNVSLQSQPRSGSKNTKKSDSTSNNNRHSKPQSPGKSQKPVSSLATKLKPLVNKDTGKPQLRSSQTIPHPKTAGNKEKMTPTVASAAAKERTGARRSLGSALQAPSTKVPACKSGLIKPGMLQQKSGLPRGSTKSSKSSADAPSHKGPMKAMLPMPSQLKKPSSVKKMVKPDTSRSSSADITETPVKENKCVKPKQILSQAVTPPRQSVNSDGLSTPASIKRSTRKSLLPTPKKSVSSIGSVDSSVFGRNGSSVSSIESFTSLDTPAKKALGQSNPLTGKLIDLDINSPFKTRRTSVLHTPKNKENRMKLSAWSPLPRQKPISLEDEVIACTKRTAKLMK